MDPQRLTQKSQEALQEAQTVEHLVIALLEGLDPVFGARPLRRFIGHEVETRIARMLAGGEVEDGTTLRVDARRGQLEVSAENPPRPAEAA